MRSTESPLYFIEMPPTALLLIAHGSRRSEANAELAELARLLRPRVPEMLVETAYLELASPTIPEGVRRCVELGARRVALLPYFLSAGVHVTEDLEALREGFRREYPGVEFVLCPPLGLHPGMVEIVFDRLREGLGAAGESGQSESGQSE